MTVTLKYVSEDNVDFLQFIINLLSSEDGLQLISWVLGMLSGNNPSPQIEDDESDMEIDEMFKEITRQKQDEKSYEDKLKNENSPTKIVGEGYALSPIARVAGKDIIFMLTRYFAKV